MTLRSVLEIAGEGKTLTQAQMKQAIEALLDPAASPAQSAALLTALHVRGETPDELAGAVTALQRHMTPLQAPKNAHLLDTCGTGGGKPTFNVSTAAALVAAAAGCTVAKHGNKAVTSTCGSVDVIEALGIPAHPTPSQAAFLLKKTGLCFCFAPHHHPAMKNAAPVRAALPFRTLFNLAGPLANPANAQTRVLGVYHPKLVKPMACTLKEIGVEHALVVHGGGLDEFSTLGTNTLAELKEGHISTYKVSPKRVGLEKGAFANVKGGNAQYNAALILKVLKGTAHKNATNLVALNAGAGIYVNGKADTLKQGVELARQAIASGSAQKKYEEHKKEANKHA